MEIVGRASAVTVNVGELLPVPAVGVCVVVTPEVVLGLAPSVVLVTLKVTVQLLLPGMVMPLKLRAVALALKLDGVVPAQVPPTAPPTALMFTRVSLNAALVRADPLLLIRLMVTTELEPDVIEFGLNDLVTVGGAYTVSVAMLLPLPAVGD